MKIAVASADGVTVSAHFGRSRCFLVYTVQDGKVAGQELRDNTYTPHSQGQCHGEGDPSHAAAPHSHAAVVQALHDCDLVLCGGMGWRAAQELQAAGVRPVALGVSGPAQEVLDAFLAGKIQPQSSFCRCHD